MPTPRTPLPRAALIAVGDAMTAIEAAAQLLRELLRREPANATLAGALTHLARAQTRCGEALQATKGGSMSEATERRPGRQVPSVGRIVHYVAYGTPGGEFPVGAHRAAIITEVDQPGDPESSVGLVVFNPTGQYFDRGLPFDATGQAPGTWHWPEPVPPV